MMNFIWAAMMLISIVFGILTGRVQEVSDAVFSGGKQAVELSLFLLGTMSFFSGIMRIGDKSGMTGAMAKLCGPVLRVLFPGLDSKGPAARAISMNVAANLLGLGNAATPLGLQAMKHLDQENPLKGTATQHMVTFVVMNTASIQLIPTTIAALRAKHGSLNPMEIMPAVWVSSVVALLVGVLLAKLLASKKVNA